MKKLFLGLFFLGLLAIPMIGLAQPFISATAPPNVELTLALERITQWAFAILIFIAVFFIIVGGYYYVTAGGDAAKLGVARNFLIYALIGVAVAFLARGLVAFVNTVIQ